MLNCIFSILLERETTIQPSPDQLERSIWEHDRTVKTVQKSPTRKVLQTALRFQR